MTIKKVRRTNLKRSLFIGLIGVASVLGMVSVGFASWSFADTSTSFYVGAGADDVIISVKSLGLGTFGIKVDESSTVSVDHFKYALNDGENEISDDDYVDVYGDLNIHTGIGVDIFTNESGVNINSISFDDLEYSYLKIDMEFQSLSFINVGYNSATLKLENLPQYYLEPEHTNYTWGVTYYDFYIPIKSTTKMSLFTLASIDSTVSSNYVPLDLDFSFDLSNGLSGNKNIPSEIDIVYSLISEAEYESDIQTGGGH